MIPVNFFADMSFDREKIKVDLEYLGLIGGVALLLVGAIMLWFSYTIITGSSARITLAFYIPFGVILSIFGAVRCLGWIRYWRRRSRLEKLVDSSVEATIVKQHLNVIEAAAVVNHERHLFIEKGPTNLVHAVRFVPTGFVGEKVLVEYASENPDNCFFKELFVSDKVKDTFRRTSFNNGVLLILGTLVMAAAFIYVAGRSKESLESSFGMTSVLAFVGISIGIFTGLSLAESGRPSRLDLFFKKSKKGKTIGRAMSGLALSNLALFFLFSDQF